MSQFGGDINSREGFNAAALIEAVARETRDVKEKLEVIKSKGSSISIADMFEMQMKMNKLNQLSEMSSGVVAASNSAISSAARNIKS